MKGSPSLLLVAMLATPLLAQAVEPEQCQTVRFSDVGWTDITVTTAVTSVVLEALGYKTHTTMISVPVTYKSLAAGKDLDVFLGNWMPTMENDIKQYRDAGTVETVRANPRTPSTPLPYPKHCMTRASRTSPTFPSSRTNWAARSTASSRATTATVPSRA